MTEQPSAPVDPIAYLDFTVTCEIFHGGVRCTRPATHTAHVHRCRDKTNGAATRDDPVFVCAWMVTECLHTKYPTECAACKHKFGSFLDRIWDIQEMRKP